MNIEPCRVNTRDGLLARGLVNLVPVSGRSGSVVADVYAIIGSLRVTIPWRSDMTRTSMLGVVPLVFEILPVACWYEEDVSRGEYGRTSGSFKNSSNMQDVRPSRKKTQRMQMKYTRTVEICRLYMFSQRSWVGKMSTCRHALS